MIKDFNHDEKKALVAIIKFIIAADGKISDSEIEKSNEVAETKGFEDFTDIYREVDREVNTIDDIKDLIHKVREETHEYDILKIAMEMAMADADIALEEDHVISIMCKEWNIDINTLLTGDKKE